MDWILSRVGEIIVGLILIVGSGFFLDWLDAQILKAEWLSGKARWMTGELIMLVFIGLTMMAVGHAVISLF